MCAPKTGTFRLRWADTQVRPYCDAKRLRLKGFYIYTYIY